MSFRTIYLLTPNQEIEGSIPSGPILKYEMLVRLMDKRSLNVVVPKMGKNFAYLQQEVVCFSENLL